MSEHNELVGQGESQKDPYRAKGSDFPVKAVMAGTGQSGAHGTAEGKDMLVSQGHNLEGPRNLESASPNGPSEWGKGGKAFSVGQASEGSISVDNPLSIDLATGKQMCKGYKATV